MTEDQIKHMTNRFLGWPLPADFRPDNGISVKRPNYAPGVQWEPTGTNLFDARQAEEMVRYMVEGLPRSEQHAAPTPEEHERGIAAAAEYMWERLRASGPPNNPHWRQIADTPVGRAFLAEWCEKARPIIGAYLAAVGLAP